MSDTRPTVFYRYQDGETYQHLTVVLREFAVIAETPKGYWVVPLSAARIDHPKYLKSIRKWTSKKGRAKYCYPSKAAAWESYQCRKRHHAAILEQQLETAKARLRGLESLNATDPPARHETVLSYRLTWPHREYD